MRCRNITMSVRASPRHASGFCQVDGETGKAGIPGIAHVKDVFVSAFDVE
jgi:hypothetical protein